jgi:hypothetical protein
MASQPSDVCLFSRNSSHDAKISALNTPKEEKKNKKYALALMKNRHP